MNPSERTEPTPRERASRNLALACAMALIALLLMRDGLLLGGWSWAAIKALPLAIALPGLWRYRMYTFRWLSLAVWLYAGEAALHLGEGRDLLQAGLRLVVAIVLFGAVSAHIRWRLAAAKAS